MTCRALIQRRTASRARPASSGIVRRCILAVAASVAMLPAASAGPQESKPADCANPERTLSVDVIELVAGRELPGKAELAIEHEGITYLFATPENRDRFSKDPRAFEVADGGACGRMGPLSGLGDARRYLVHDGRVWFFASDGCREGFRKKPSAFIERPDPRPTPGGEQAAAGAETMDLLTRWAGGAEALRRLESVRLSSKRDRPSGEKVYAWTWEIAMRFPDRALVREAWDDSWFSTIRAPEGVAMASSRGVGRVARSRAEAFDRVLGRSPAMMIVAWARAGAAGAANPAEIVASGAGEGTIDGVAVRFVDVWMRGASSRLAIDSATGRPLRQTFHGREGGTRIGEVARVFTADAAERGIRLPVAWTVTLDGKPVESESVRIDRIEIDPQLPPESFAIGGT